MRVDPGKKFGGRECPSCAVEVEINNNRCPICGYEFSHPSPRQKYMKIWGAIIMLIIFGLLVLRIF